MQWSNLELLEGAIYSIFFHFPLKDFILTVGNEGIGGKELDSYQSVEHERTEHLFRQLFAASIQSGFSAFRRTTVNSLKISV